MYITLDAIDFEIFYNFFFVSIDNKKKGKNWLVKVEKYLADRSIPFKIPNLTARR